MTFQFKITDELVSYLVIKWLKLLILIGIIYYRIEQFVENRILHVV